MMISRSLAPSLTDALAHSPAVALLGPRQAGKTTLALEVARRPSLYLDLELAPFNLLETRHLPSDQLWLRGGFPESLLAPSAAQSLRWRKDFIRSYLERDISQFGPRIAAETLRRFWGMLAHHQGGLLNTAQLARNLGVDAKTAAAYLALLVDLLLVRRLPPWHANIGKRLVKSPKVHVRDSGLVHALLGIPDKKPCCRTPSSAKAGNASSSKTCSPARRKECRATSTAAAAAPKSISCWSGRTATCGPSKSSAA